MEMLRDLFGNEIGTVVPLQDVIEFAFGQHFWLVAMKGQLLQTLESIGGDVTAKHSIVEVAAQSLLDVSTECLQFLPQGLGCHAEVA